MSRRELTALLGFLCAVSGSAYLGWLLFRQWPRNGAFDAHYEPGSSLAVGFSAFVIAIAALQNWRRNEPQADERDVAIDGAAAKHGFYALALLNLVAGVVVQANPELVLQFGAEWIRYALLWLVLLSLAVFGGCQLYRYRRG